MKETYGGLLMRNANFLLENEDALFKRLGMEKVGFEGIQPNLFTGGTAWYIAKFPGDDSYFTISFDTWFGTIRMTHQRLLNPKLGDGT